MSGFGTKAEIPADWTSARRSTSQCWLNMMTGIADIKSFRTRAASIPFITGIEKSITIRSGRNS
jgi:hypothetical protein